MQSLLKTETYDVLCKSGWVVVVGGGGGGGGGGRRGIAECVYRNSTACLCMCSVSWADSDFLNIFLEKTLVGQGYSSKVCLAQLALG